MSTPNSPYSEGVPKDAPGQPIKWHFDSVGSFVEGNYWHRPEDAIGDIRLFISMMRKRDHEEIMQKIAEGERDLSDGRFSPHAEVVDRMSEKWG